MFKHRGKRFGRLKKKEKIWEGGKRILTKTKGKLIVGFLLTVLVIAVCVCMCVEFTYYTFEVRGSQRSIQF